MKKMINNKSILLTSITTIAFVLSVSAQAKIYKWVDANGQVHYTAQPPAQKKEVKIAAVNIEEKIRNQAGKYRAPSSKTVAADSEESEKTETTTQLAGPDKQLMAYCASQRNNLKQLRKNFRNVWIDASGKKTALDQKQRKEKVTLIENQIKEECSEVKSS